MGKSVALKKRLKVILMVDEGLTAESQDFCILPLLLMIDYTNLLLITNDYMLASANLFIRRIAINTSEYQLQSDSNLLIPYQLLSVSVFLMVMIIPILALL